MLETDDVSEGEVSPLSARERGQSLCYRCRRISPETIFASGGLSHCDNLDELIGFAESCDLCRLFKDGLLKDASENFGHDPLAVHEWINIRPELWQVSERGGPLQSGLCVRACSTGISCKLNWYLAHNEQLSSPVRPEGIQKLYLAKAWLNQSIQSSERHDKSHSFRCNDQITPSDFAPTRLLDLGIGPYDRPDGICLLSYCDKLPYIALSHRWGGSQHLTTTRSNYRRHVLGIQFATLPKTFQDAIQVARFLGVRYMWIDALCIVQDDSVDWHREAILMGNIYQEALCTFAIHGAHNDSTGFLKRCLSPPATVQLGSAQTGKPSRVAARSNFRADVDKSELSRRGWVLQERFLSTRTLHFAENSLFCEDARGVFTEENASDILSGRFLPLSIAATNTQDAAVLLHTRNSLLPLSITETGPHDATLSVHRTGLSVSDGLHQPTLPIAIGNGKLWNKQPCNLKSGEQLQEEDWPVSHNWVPRRQPIIPFSLSARYRTGLEYGGLEYLWFELLERYSNTKLTYDSDKLPAIAGLVKVFQRHTFDGYLSGIWRKTLHTGLLWTACGIPLKRPQVKRAASWSWASMDGPIQHPDASHISRLSLVSYMPGQILETFDINCSLKIWTRIKRLDSLEAAPKDDSLSKCRESRADNFFSRPVNLHRLFAARKRLPMIWFTPDNIEQERLNRAVLLPGPAGFAVLDEQPAYPGQLPEIWCVDIAKDSRTFVHAHWVLLVKQSLSRPGSWCRVGVGVVLGEYESLTMSPGVDWFEDVEPTTITLV